MSSSYAQGFNVSKAGRPGELISPMSKNMQIAELVHWMINRSRKGFGTVNHIAKGRTSCHSMASCIKIGDRSARDSAWLLLRHQQYQNGRYFLLKQGSTGRVATDQPLSRVETALQSCSQPVCHWRSLMDRELLTRKCSLAVEMEEWVFMWLERTCSAVP